MFWSRLVGWFECVAFADPSAVQRHQSRDPRNMEIPVSTGGNSYLPAEFGYPFFIWSTRTLKIWLLSVCAMHVVIAVAMGMYLFSLVMIVLNLAAFGTGLFARTKQIRLQPERASA